MTKTPIPKTTIQPGATIGIIGGGQLGRMLAISAARMGYHTHIYVPEANSPAEQVASKTTHAAYTDTKALRDFARSVDVVTYEFENIPTECVEVLAQERTVSPSVEVLRVSQHRGREKDFVRSIGIETAPYEVVRSVAELEAAIDRIGQPGVLKTTRFGYDGKGQCGIREGVDVARAWESLKTGEAIYEGFVDYEAELSVIVARNEVSGTLAYAPVKNEHVNHILDTTIAPAPFPKPLRREAIEIAKKIADALDLRGLLAVELFLTKNNRLLVNELAPRPHNSGHWTIDACVTSQFEQAVRAICGLPLGSTKRLHNAVMKNLIGDEVHLWYDYLQEPNNKLHLYGKTEVRPGRKMGHVTQLVRKSKPDKAHWSTYGKAE